MQRRKGEYDGGIKSGLMYGESVNVNVGLTRGKGDKEVKD